MLFTLALKTLMMCGRATFTTVWSRMLMNRPMMVTARTVHLADRPMPRVWLGRLIAAVAIRRPSPWPPPLGRGNCWSSDLDGHFSGGAGEQHVAGVLDSDLDRHPLGNFGVVAAGVVLWQQREGGGAGRRNGHDRPLQRLAEGVQVHVNRLTDIDPVDLAFVHIGRDPEVAKVHDLEDRLSGADDVPD